MTSFKEGLAASLHIVEIKLWIQVNCVVSNPSVQIESKYGFPLFRRIQVE